MQMHTSFHWALIRRGLVTALVCAALSACASGPELSSASSRDALVPAAPTDLSATYASLRAAGGRVFTLNPALSEVRIYAFRAGKAAKFGHNHVLSAPAFEGFFHLFLRHNLLF